MTPLITTREPASRVSGNLYTGPSGFQQAFSHVGFAVCWDLFHPRRLLSISRSLGMLHVGSRCSFGFEWDAGGKGIFCCRRQNISSTVLVSFMQYPHGGTPRNLQGSPQIGNSSQQPILSTKLQLRKPLIPADDAKYDKTMVTRVTSIVWCRVRCLVMPLCIHYDVR